MYNVRDEKMYCSNMEIINYNVGYKEIDKLEREKRMT